MSFFTWFFNLFKSNKVIMQLAVQSIAGEYFMRHPETKATVQALLTKTISDINSFVTPLNTLPQLLKDNLKISGVSAPTQALVLVLIDSLTPPITLYLSKTTLTLPEQTATIVELMGWVNDISKV